MESNNKTLPAELRRFFLASGGHSLIIRGNAGVGKTTFALQMIEELEEIENSFYYSTRVSDQIMLNQFPWLAKKVYGEDVGDTVREEILRQQEMELRNEQKETEAADEQGELKRPWLDRMKLVWGSGVSYRMGQNLQQTKVDTAPLESIYSNLERYNGERTLVVLDSVDAMSETCGINQASIITTIQKDLVERRRADFIFVLESNDRYLDYLGDGVMELSVQELHRRRLREMNILKLRGCAINQPRYIFTLDGARIRTFPDRLDLGVPKGKRWDAIPDANGKASLGMKDLDRLMQGGVPPGSIFLIELGSEVPVNVSHMLEGMMVANFASQGRGVFWLPMKKETAESARERITSMVSGDQFSRFVRIPEVASQMGSASEVFIMPVEGTDANADMNWRRVQFSMKTASSPFMSLIGFDTLESIYGGDVMDDMADHFASIKHSKGIFVGMVSPSTKSKDRLVDLATHRLKLDRIGGTVVLYGIEPFTEINALTVDGTVDRRNVSLVPII